MDHYSLEDRLFLIKQYYKNDENITQTLRKWSTQFKNRPKPHFNTIKDLIEKFESTKSLHDDTENRRNRSSTSRTPEIIQKAREIHQDEPTISTRRLSQILGVSQSTAQKLLTKDLKLFPYKVSLGQQLTQAAVEKRLEFANLLLQLIDTDKIDTKKIIFSDEAHFWLDGYVNRQNYRIWGSQKPELVRTKPLHPKKLTVWCGMTGNRIIGPFFFESTITSESYNHFLKNDFIPQARRMKLLRDHYFQQDGAPPHSTRENLSLLESHFGDRVIARNFPMFFNKGLEWAPYSPDLSPLDFFLWGFVKDSVYKDNPKSLIELKNKIIEIISSIPDETLKRAIASFETRLRMIVHTDGNHIENILH